MLNWLTVQGEVRGGRLEYSVGIAVTEKIRDADHLVPKTAWTPASDADGGVRDGGDVAELTGLLDLTSWPQGMRIILTAWTRLLAFTGDAAVLASCEPKPLRHRFLHVPARLTKSARRRRLRIPETWPWANAIVAVFAAIPEPA